MLYATLVLSCKGIHHASMERVVSFYVRTPSFLMVLKAIQQGLLWEAMHDNR